MLIIRKSIEDSNPTIFGGNIIWYADPYTKEGKYKGRIVVKDNQGNELFNRPYQKLEIGYNNGFIYVYLEDNKKITDPFLAY